MKNIAIICEYNPMHNGHKYQIQQIKEKYPDANIVAIMSGSFVQRGEPSVIDKFDKSYIAIKNGIDLVLEMPTIISLQSANYFGYYNAKILNDLKSIDYISFGIEEDDEEKFFTNIDEIIKSEAMISELQKEYLDLGNSYKVAYLKALEDLRIDTSILSKPNNTLAFQYVLSLKKLNSDIKFLPIKRKDGGYESFSLDENEFQSATTIRNLYKSNLEFKEYIPKETYEKLLSSPKYDIDNYSDILYFLVNIENRRPENIAGYENGILNLIMKNFTDSISEAVNKSHNKRYSISRLQRFLVNYLLNIDNSDIRNLESINYIRPLAFNDNGTNILRQIKDNSNIEIINNISQFANNPFNQRYINIDMKAYELQNIISKEKIEKDYKNNPYIEK